MSHHRALKQWRDGQITKALETMASAAKAGDDSFEFHSDYASLYTLSGDFAAALEHHGKASEKNAQWEDEAFRRGLIHLIKGEYAQGWPLYLQRQSLIAPHLKPKWNGDLLPEGTILLYTDQGLGDAIQFVRYAQMVKARCSHLKLLCKPELVDLLSTAFQFDEVFRAEKNSLPSPAAYDCWLGIADLPATFGTFVGNQLPPAPAVFQVDPSEVAKWQARFGPEPEFRVGVAWRGSPKNPLKPVRDIPPISFRALSAVSGVRLVTLQQAPRVDEVRKLGKQNKVTDLTIQMDQPGWSLLDTAAVLLNLNLVITCDTMVAHLAASLGTETWIALPTVPDWRWGLIGDITAWYPNTVRLFRRPQAIQWIQFFETIADSLGQHPDLP